MIKREKEGDKLEVKNDLRDTLSHPSRKDNRAEAFWIPKMMWQLLCNLYILRSKRSPTECERADNQDALFTWGTGNAPSSLLLFSLPFFLSHHSDEICGASSVALSAGHVNPSDDSPRRKGYYLLRKNRGALKANLTVVYLLWLRWNLRNQRLRWVAEKDYATTFIRLR